MNLNHLYTLLSGAQRPGNIDRFKERENRALSLCEVDQRNELMITVKFNLNGQNFMILRFEIETQRGSQLQKHHPLHYFLLPIPNQKLLGQTKKLFASLTTMPKTNTLMFLQQNSCFTLTIKKFLRCN